MLLFFIKILCFVFFFVLIIIVVGVVRFKVYGYVIIKMVINIFKVKINELLIKYYVRVEIIVMRMIIGIKYFEIIFVNFVIGVFEF